MPYRSGMIYGDSTTDPDLGVSIADVQQAAPATIKRTVNGVTETRNSSDLGVLAGTTKGSTVPDNAGGASWTVSSRVELCTWARYKPIIVNNSTTNPILGPITETQRANVNYGITNIPEWSLFANMVNFWTAYMPHRQQYDDISQWAPDCGIQNSYWTYQLPTGGTRAPYRITDFVCKEDISKGYYKNAGAPIGAIDVAEVSNALVSITYKMNYEGVTAGLTVTFSDLSVMRDNYKYQNLYFGIAIKAGNDKYLVTQSTPVGTMDTTGWTLWSLGAHARFKVESTSGGIFTCMSNNTPFEVFPILSSEIRCYERTVGEQIVIDPIIPYTQGQSGTYIALGEKESVTLQVAYVYANINMLSAWKSLSQSQNKFVFYSFTLQNSDVELAHTFVWNLYVKDANGTTIGSIANQSINIAKGGTYSRTNKIEVAKYFSGATTVTMEVSVSSIDTATLKKTTYASTIIYDDL